MLNNYLIDFNYAKEIGKNYSNDKVTEFFKQLSDKSKTDPEVRMIRSFFNSFYKERKKDTDRELQEIVDELQKPEPNTEALKEIEELIDVLKYQCAESYARMKGGK